VNATISAETIVAGVAGFPIDHSLSPLLHNAWLAAAGIDGVYVAFRPPRSGFARFAEGLRGGVIRGLNVTAPFKEDALAAADGVSGRCERSGSANLLVFQQDGSILADNTDGEGLLRAFRVQLGRFDPSAGPVVVLGAGGAARGAVAAFLDAGAPAVRILNRSADRAHALREIFGDRVEVIEPGRIDHALSDAQAVINATPQGLKGAEGPDIPFTRLPSGCAIMDMVYRPIRTKLLERAKAAGLPTVDGLEMLIGQAIPSFKRFFGQPPPPLDARAVAIAALETIG
jgi:shikimate dehydrogenase